MANELKGVAVTQTPVEDYEYATKPGRSITHNVGAVIIDVLVASTSLYFIVFAALAYVWNDRPASDFESKALLRAAALVSLIMVIPKIMY